MTWWTQLRLAWPFIRAAFTRGREFHQELRRLASFIPADCTVRRGHGNPPPEFLKLLREYQCKAYADFLAAGIPLNQLPGESALEAAGRRSVELGREPWPCPQGVPGCTVTVASGHSKGLGEDFYRQAERGASLAGHGPEFFKPILAEHRKHHGPPAPAPATMEWTFQVTTDLAEVERRVMAVDPASPNGDHSCGVVMRGSSAGVLTVEKILHAKKIMDDAGRRDAWKAATFAERYGCNLKPYTAKDHTMMGAEEARTNPRAYYSKPEHADAAITCAVWWQAVLAALSKVRPQFLNQRAGFRDGGWGMLAAVEIHRMAGQLKTQAESIRDYQAGESSRIKELEQARDHAVAARDHYRKELREMAEGRSQAMTERDELRRERDQARVAHTIAENELERTARLRHLKPVGSIMGAGLYTDAGKEARVERALRDMALDRFPLLSVESVRPTPQDLAVKLDSIAGNVEAIKAQTSPGAVPLGARRLAENLGNALRFLSGPGCQALEKIVRELENQPDNRGTLHRIANDLDSMVDTFYPAHAPVADAIIDLVDELRDVAGR